MPAATSSNHHHPNHHHPNHHHPNHHLHLLTHLLTHYFPPTPGGGKEVG